LLQLVAGDFAPNNIQSYDGSFVDNGVATICRVARTEDDLAGIFMRVQEFYRNHAVGTLIGRDEVSLTPEDDIAVGHLFDGNDLAIGKARVHAVAINREVRRAVVERAVVYIIFGCTFAENIGKPVQLVELDIKERYAILIICRLRPERFFMIGPYFQDFL